MVPSPKDEIDFLVKLQRLLAEGSFVASYKYALLLALADLSIERGDDSGAPLTIATAEIAEKFIQYYWRQVLPYPSPKEPRVLQQNTGKQAAIVNTVRDAHAAYAGSLVSAVREQGEWKRLVGQVAKVVAVMPLWKLQTIGRVPLEFLYAKTGNDREIELQRGVAFCFRKFHSLIGDMVRGAWLRFVRQQNLDVLGETADLTQFLFGSERNNLAAVRPVLMDLQHGRCFYCQGSIARMAHVDHFIAWSRYPTDLGHNFVLADDRCNNKKRDRLPAREHLERWAERNAMHGAELTHELSRRGIVTELLASNRITAWAYSQAEAASALTWVRADEMVPLAAGWSALLARVDHRV
jgi:5-methylcytosine-specific restriction endonuclease McrA